MQFTPDDDPFVVESFNRHAAKMADEHNLFKKVARLSVYDMVRYTPMNIRQNRLKGCRVYFFNSEYFDRSKETSGTTEKGKRGLRLFAYKTGCNKHTYMTQIGFVDYTKNMKSSVWVSCQCDYYKYNLEYVNAKLGASDHLYAWQQPPKITNPNMVPGACKHILAILDDAMRRTRQYAKLDKNKDLEVDDSEIDETEDKSKELKELREKQEKRPIEKERSPDSKQKGLIKLKPQPFRPFTNPKNTQQDTSEQTKEETPKPRMFQQIPRNNKPEGN